MRPVKAKKFLGQHFLKDESIASDIVDSLTNHGNYKTILEIGPGMGVLTQFLLKKTAFTTYVNEIDRESVAYLKNKWTELSGRIIEGDFLRMDLKAFFPEPVAIIGNFPYNISSQIFFKILKDRDHVPEVVCMLQKEVAQRIASPPGNKAYGILSVFLQAFYELEYLFTVEPHVFHPEPKVKSGVIRLKRNGRVSLDCSEEWFFKVVKQGFQNRRKTLRNALKSFNLPADTASEAIFDKRAEQLSVEDFIYLTHKIQP
ncbi:MAG: 16S rRNA (adenine(1518)-N(6)/adenine(1519)-N(6))-dimethyltransferase RsmA [Cytophagaceae bacterium]